MKILLSPAKSLVFNKTLPTTRNTKPVFKKKADYLNSILKEKSPDQLKSLMHISQKLADLNWQRNQEWKQTSEIRQAVFTFDGAAYTGLDAYSINEKNYDYLQDSLRILSGQYGVLKPFDEIKPYRLEMGAKLVVNDYKNLYEFWGNTVTDFINDELNKAEVLVNLASNEYFKVIKNKLINNRIITPIFKDYKNGKYKVISFFAKKARGLMSRYAIDNQIQDVEQLKNFEMEGYAYDEKLSTKSEWVFTR